METSLMMQLSLEFQALSGADGLAVLTLAILEGVLSVDNSLVLAILVRTLPKAQQKKALMYGIFGAFFFRVVALVFAAHLMQLVVFKIIGGGYLLYLAMKHMFFFYKEDAHQPRPKIAASFWKTVLVVEFTDIAFSIDSITTAVAMSDKLIVVWIAGIMGILFLRFAAGIFIRLLEKLPKLEDLAYQLIFFVGTKLILEGFHIEISHAVFWMMMAVIGILGSALVYRDYFQTRTKTRFHNRLLARLEADEITVDEVLALEYIPREIIIYLRDTGALAVQQKD
jgi:YkoY family integral membrane protein